MKRKKSAARKTKQKKTPHVNFSLFLGLALGVALFFAYLFIFSKKNEKTTVFEKPYYDKQVFKEPTGLIKGVSTDAAKLKIPIIMFHYVENVKDPNDTIRKGLSISPYTFRKELEALANNQYQTYFLKDVQDILEGNINYSTRSAILTFDDGYEDFYTDAFPLLKKYQIKSTIFIINNYIGRKGFLNKTQIKELVDSKLVEVGAHTLNHIYLKTVQEKIAKREITESKLELERMFGISVKSFAYPFGAFDQQTLNLVKEATYSAAVSVIPGTLQNEDNIFYLSRLRSGMFSGENIVRVLENYKK